MNPAVDSPTIACQKLLSGISRLLGKAQPTLQGHGAGSCGGIETSLLDALGLHHAAQGVSQHLARSGESPCRDGERAFEVFGRAWRRPELELQHARDHLRPRPERPRWDVEKQTRIGKGGTLESEKAVSAAGRLGYHPQRHLSL